jgi:hypothetical protein
MTVRVEIAPPCDEHLGRRAIAKEVDGVWPVVKHDWAVCGRSRTWGLWCATARLAAEGSC